MRAFLVRASRSLAALPFLALVATSLAGQAATQNVTPPLSAVDEAIRAERYITPPAEIARLVTAPREGNFSYIIGPLIMAAPQAFAPTEVGVSELKTLPAGVLLKAQGQGNYFRESNGLFRPLFNYISTHNIAMTTPVEAKIDDAAMYFWVAESERSKVAGSAGGVEVVEIPERRVASLGARGSYSATNFAKTRDALVAWLSTQPGVEPAGPAYGVYWNGPFTPGFLKRFEVHVPVRTTVTK